MLTAGHINKSRRYKHNLNVKSVCFNHGETPDCIAVDLYEQLKKFLNNIYFKVKQQKFFKI